MAEENAWGRGVHIAGMWHLTLLALCPSSIFPYYSVFTLFCTLSSNKIDGMLVKIGIQQVPHTHKVTLCKFSAIKVHLIGGIGESFTEEGTSESWRMSQLFTSQERVVNSMTCQAKGKACPKRMTPIVTLVILAALCLCPQAVHVGSQKQLCSMDRVTSLWVDPTIYYALKLTSRNISRKLGSYREERPRNKNIPILPYHGQEAPSWRSWPEVSLLYLLSDLLCFRMKCFCSYKC